MLGAFGVTMAWPGAQKLRTQLGLLSRVYKTSPLKDFASPFREPDAADDAAIMALLKDVHEQFAGLLCSKRSLNPTAFEEIADGRLISGRRALHLGLIDELGGLETAFAWLRSRGLVAGDPPYSIVFLGDPRPGSGSTSGNPFDFLKSLLQPT
jgi:protease-4